VLVVLAVALTIGLMVPGSELDLNRQSIIVPTQSTVGFACVKNGATTGGELGRCSWISAGTVFEVGRGIVPAGPRVSTADIVRVQSTFISSCGGCTDVLNRLADPTSLLLVGTTLAGLGVVLRKLRRRRAIGGQ
jgi:hypothetical protein